MPVYGSEGEQGSTKHANEHTGCYIEADALTGISEETLIGILLDGGQKYFCISTDGKNWTRSKETVSNDFPVKDIYATVLRMQAASSKQ